MMGGIGILELLILVGVFGGGGYAIYYATSSSKRKKMLVCPWCAELIPPKAPICPHCQRDPASFTRRKGSDPAP